MILKNNNSQKIFVCLMGLEILNLLLNFVIMLLFKCDLTFYLFFVNIIIEIFLFYFYVTKMKLIKNQIMLVLILLSLQFFFQMDVLVREKMNTGIKTYIAHAGGGIKDDGKIYRYLNCQETFQECIEKNINVIEYDVLFSSDNKPIFTHDFEYMKEFSFNKRPTFNEYCNYKIMGKYTPVTLDFILERMKEIKNLIVMFDCKEQNIIEVYDYIDDEAEKYGVDVLNRIMPQVYDSQIYFKCSENLKFSRYAYSNYKSNYKTNKLKDFISKADKIEVVIFSTENKKDINIKKIKELNKIIAVHTINKKLVANYHFATSVSWVFTDCLY